MLKTKVTKGLFLTLSENEPMCRRWPGSQLFLSPLIDQETRKYHTAIVPIVGACKWASYCQADNKTLEVKTFGLNRTFAFMSRLSDHQLRLRTGMPFPSSAPGD